MVRRFAFLGLAMLALSLPACSSKRPPAPPPPVPPCAGDCDGDRVVTEAEVGKCRDILDDADTTPLAPLAPPATAPATAPVDIGELQAAVNAHLNGCPR
jgi:hypothetical protein